MAPIYKSIKYHSANLKSSILLTLLNFPVDRLKLEGWLGMQLGLRDSRRQTLLQI